MDIIDKWKEEARVAFSEYKKRDCGTRVYTKDCVCRRAEYSILNAYIDYICLTKGGIIAGNYRRYTNKGDSQRKDMIKIIVREWNLS